MLAFISLLFVCVRFLVLLLFLFSSLASDQIGKVYPIACMYLIASVTFRCRLFQPLYCDSICWMYCFSTTFTPYTFFPFTILLARIFFLYRIFICRSFFSERLFFCQLLECVSLQLLRIKYMLTGDDRIEAVAHRNNLRKGTSFFCKNRVCCCLF